MTAYATQMAAARRDFNRNRADQPSTVKQRDYIRKLASERGEAGQALLGTIDQTAGAIDMLTKKQASNIIDQLINAPRAKAKAKIPAAPVAELVAGFYLHNGEIVKVQAAVHGSGRLYAKRLVLVDGAGGSFDYAPGLIRDIKAEEALTLEQAKEFGQLYGVCCRCGAVLTDETSIANGIGPVCGSKF